MTVEEVHNHNRQWALNDISYDAVCTTEFICGLRQWITKQLEKAYEAGFNAAKEGKI